MRFTVNRRVPSACEYNALRRSVDWPTFADNVVELGLAQSSYCIVVEDEVGTVVGMGRIIGDNAIYMHIQDVIVRPDLQRQGIGKLIMKELLTYVDGLAGKNTNIGLMCSKGREAFYRTFGFVDRPSEKFGSGMIKVIA